MSPGLAFEVRLVGPSHPVRTGSSQLTPVLFQPGLANAVEFGAHKILTSVGTIVWIDLHTNI